MSEEQKKKECLKLIQEEQYKNKKESEEKLYQPPEKALDEDLWQDQGEQGDEIEDDEDEEETKENPKTGFFDDISKPVERVIESSSDEEEENQAKEPSIKELTGKTKEERVN